MSSFIKSEIGMVNIVLGTKCMAITDTLVILKPPPPLLIKCQRPRECKEKGGWLGGGLNQTAYQRPRECKDKGGGFNQTAYTSSILRLISFA